MVNFVFRRGKRIFVPNDEYDNAKRAALNAERDKLMSLVGSLTCPQSLQLCDVSIAICEDRFLEVVNMCHEDYVTLIRDRLSGSGYQFRRLTV
jgi:hypothetical protein